MYDKRHNHSECLPSRKVILSRFHLAMSKKRIFCVVSEIDDGPEFLNAPCLAGKDTVKKSSDRAVNAVPQNEERLPVDSRHRPHHVLWHVMFPVPGLVIGLAVVTP